MLHRQRLLVAPIVPQKDRHRRPRLHRVIVPWSPHSCSSLQPVCPSTRPARTSPPQTAETRQRRHRELLYADHHLRVHVLRIQLQRLLVVALGLQRLVQPRNKAMVRHADVRRMDRPRITPGEVRILVPGVVLDALRRSGSLPGSSGSRSATGSPDPPPRPASRSESRHARRAWYPAGLGGRARGRPHISKT